METMTDKEHDQLVDDIKKTVVLESISILDRIVLYSEYLSAKADLREVSLDQFNLALSDIYPFMDDADVNKENIQKITIICPFTTT